MIGVVVAAVIVVVVVIIQTVRARRCGTGSDSIGCTAPTVARLAGYRTARSTSDWAPRIAGPTCNRATRYWMRRPNSSCHPIAPAAVETTGAHTMKSSAPAKSATSTTTGKCHLSVSIFRGSK